MLTSIQHSKSLTLLLVAAGALSVPELGMAQATVNWGPAQDTTGPSDLAPGGAVIEARNGLVNVGFESDNPAFDVTIGGVFFDATNFFGRVLNIADEVFLDGKTTGDADYDNLIGNATGSDGTVGPSGTLTNVNYEIRGLITGEDYLIQIWHCDARPVSDTRFITIDAAVTLFSGLNADPTGFGQYTVGTFTALGSTQIVNFDNMGTANRAFCSAIMVRVDTGGTIGTNYCGPGASNSSGSSGVMSATGSNVAASNNLTLTTSNLPNSQFGIFLTSMTQAFVPGGNGSSNGNICLGGSIGRYIGPAQILSTGTTGSFSLAINLTAMPQGNGTVPVVAGQTWNFQGWHRDGVGLGSNFTDGIEILFQ